jgi:uroporphyrinogen-III synthase
VTDLQGLRVVVTAPRGSDLAALLRDGGAEVIEIPTIEIVDPTSWDPLKNAARDLAAGRFDWVLFTSRNSVTRALQFFQSELESARVGAVGTKTAGLLESHSVAVDVVPEGGTGTDLVTAIGSGPGAVLMPRAEGAPRAPIDALEGAGWEVVHPPAYRTVAAPIDNTRLESGFDAITFTSGSTVRYLVEVSPPDSLGIAEGQQGPLVAAIGPETSDAARSVGVRVDVIAEPHTNAGLVDALRRRMGR